MQVKNYSLLLLLALAPVLEAGKHAVVVGIDTYSPGPCTRNEPQRGLILAGDCPTAPKINLANAVKDAKAFEALLRSRYGFTTAEITPLFNARAPALEILNALQTMLTKKLSKGDTAIFYFAGHGAQIRNRRSRAKQEALVPYDFLTGTYPILDLELAAIYKLAVNREIQLTVVLDSCYSGGMARGGKLRTVGDVRSIEDAREAFSFEASSSLSLLAAARGEQPASDDAKTFTQNLVEIVQAVPWERTLDEIAKLAEARLSNGQSPVAVGEAAGAINLMGKRTNQEPETYFVLDAKTRGSIHLAAGSASGLTEGSRLAETGGTGRQFTVKKVRFNEAELEAEDRRSGPAAGTRLTLVHWEPKAEESMSVALPANLPAAAQIDQLRACLPDTDPGLDAQMAPDLEITWGSGRWEISRKGAERAPFACAEAAGLAGRLVIAKIPPSRELAATLQNQLKPYQSLLQDRTDTRFEIVGRLRERRLEYALAQREGARSRMFPAITAWNRDWYLQGRGLFLYPESGQVDCVSDYRTCGTILMRRIQRYRVALNLEDAQLLSNRMIKETGARVAPFSIQIRKRKGAECSAEVVETIRAKVEYCLFLVRNGDPGDNSSWYINLFPIDGAGLRGGAFSGGEKLYPGPGMLINRREFEVTKGFNSNPSDGDTETLFLVASADTENSKLPFSDVYQRKPDGSTTRSPVRSVNGRRPELIWSVSMKILKVIP